MNLALIAPSTAPTLSRRSIALRILDCFSAGTYAWHALLQILHVVETTTVDTAAVECRLQPKLLINPEFVERHAETSEKLLMLVMHELHHVLLGHTRLFARVTPLDNLIFDAVINALLCRMFPEPEHVRFFTDFYSAERFPECFLRPPPDWRPDRPVPLPPAVAARSDFDLSEAYRGLYSPIGVGYEELYCVLTDNTPVGAAGSVPLLGDHRDESEDASSGGGLEGRSPLLRDAVREIVEKWPMPPNPTRGRSWGDLILESSVTPRRTPTNRERLRRLILRTAGISQTIGPVRQLAEDSFEIFTPLPLPERRATVLKALGHPPLLYRGSLSSRRPRRVSPKVHVYLDVSGSVQHVIGALYAAVLDCRTVIQPVVHLFSTAVSDVSFAQLRRGACNTTGGTDISCVAAHAESHGVRRAVLVTDGYVGIPSAHDAAVLGRMTVGTALTGMFANRSDLEAVTDFWTELEGIEQ